MSGSVQVHMEILEQARAYCEAVWYARTEVFEQMCHERFAMNLIEPQGPTYWDKASFIERVRNRAPANYVEIGVMDAEEEPTFCPLVRLNAGEGWAFRLAQGIAPYAKADTGAVVLQREILDN
jgi:hypothetical protein